MGDHVGRKHGDAFPLPSHAVRAEAVRRGGIRGTASVLDQRQSEQACSFSFEFDTFSFELQPPFDCCPRLCC